MHLPEAWGVRGNSGYGFFGRSAALRGRGFRVESDDMALPPQLVVQVASPPTAAIRRGQLFYPVVYGVVKRMERLVTPNSGNGVKPYKTTESGVSERWLSGR